MNTFPSPQVSATAQSPVTPPVFVLVHGAWHGGWCWQKVSACLRATGALVYTPTLSGLGDNKGNLTPTINLETHIADIVNLLLMEDLQEVILVGHSYGGIVISGVADRVPERLRKLVFLDALVAENGQSLVSMQPEENRELFQQLAAPSGGLLVPVLPAAYFGITDTALGQWVDERLAPHPFRSLTQPLALTQPLGNGLPVAYIACDSPALEAIHQFAVKAQANGGWQNYTVHTGHDAMLTAPREVANLLESLAQ